MIKKIILLGKPGAGKGTLSQILKNKFKDLHHVSTGDIFREEIKKESHLGNLVKLILQKGEYVPDALTNKILEKSIEHLDSFILDGYPRTINQAQFLDTICNIDHVFLLDISDKILINRLSQRLICEKGKHIYNLLFIKPKINNICDIDNSPLIRRKDDSPSSIKERLAVFNNKTKPLINYYKEQNKLIIMDANSNDEEHLLNIFMNEVL